MAGTRTYKIVKRYLIKGEGWKADTYEVTGTVKDALLEASGAARTLDELYGDDHFWTVDLKSELGSHLQLFHGRLS